MITARTAKFKDLEAIIDFQLKMAKETENLDLNIDEVTHGVDAIFQDIAKGVYYVAVEDEKPIACLLTTYEWSDWRNGIILWIQSVYVQEDCRGKGAFKILYNLVKDIVKQDNDLKGIRLYVEKDNLPAQHAYKSAGMDGDHYKMFEWMKGPLT